MNAPTADFVAGTASQIAFGSPIIQNNLRALIVEVIVSFALGEDWRHCSGDWKGWDFEHESGVRLEVKQTARRQTWAAAQSRYLPRFDIRERTGYWENGVSWITQIGRHAQIYVFAYHQIADDTADHRNSLQWRFHTIRTSKLPAAKTIALSTVARLSPSVVWSELYDAVERERRLL